MEILASTEDTGNQLIGSLGIYFDFNAFYMMLEVSGSKTSWSRAESYNNETAGMLIGFHW